MIVIFELYNKFEEIANPHPSRMRGRGVDVA